MSAVVPARLSGNMVGGPIARRIFWISVPVALEKTLMRFDCRRAMKVVAKASTNRTMKGALTKRIRMSWSPLCGLVRKIVQICSNYIHPKG